MFLGHMFENFISNIFGPVFCENIAYTIKDKKYSFIFF